MRQNWKLRLPAQLLLIGFALLAALFVSNLPSNAAAQNTREVRVANATALAGQNLTASIELVSQGDENAIGFTLNFNPALLTYQSGALGSGVGAGASFFINPVFAGSGRVGITLALPTDQKFAAGVRQVFTVTFSVAGNATGTTPISFVDNPTVRDVSDANGNSLTSNYTAGTITFAQTNPVPTITTLEPANRDAGGGAFTLGVNGTNFVNGAVVRWNGSDRPTAFVSDTRVNATITAADVANAGTAQVTVFNPAPGGGTSNAAVFTINAVQMNPLPVLGSLEPASRAAGSGAFSLALNGTGFLNQSTVRWNGVDRLTAFINPTRLTIDVTAADLAAPGSAVITVFNPAPGGGLSNGLTFTITQPPNPVPAITSLNPGSAQAGSGAFTLTLTGTNFVTGAVVRWNGADRVTTLISSTQVTVAIPASDIASAGTATIIVFNPLSSGGGGGPSNAVTFTINPAPNPVPVLASLNPNLAIAGGATFMLTVNGSNFVNGAAVRWNGNDRTTSFASATQLTATIPAADIVNVGNASVTVFNPPSASGGGGVSNALTFTINPPPTPVPTLTNLNPSVANAGGAAFILVVTGTNFVNGAIVRWNGSERATTFNSATQLTAQITASDLASQGTAAVTVFNPANVSGGGGASNALTFTINPPPNPVPVIGGIDPNTANAGSGAFTLTANGSNFINSSVVRWNGAERATTFVSATQLRAAIPATDIASIGTANVTVFNPASAGGGGGLSNAVGFSIGQPPNPAPTLANLNPISAIAGSGALTLTVNGANFVNGAVVRWNGTERATTFVSATQLRAALAANDVANVGTATVTVFNPAPGGGVSNGLTFTINPVPNPTPALASLNPNTVIAGGAGFTLTVSGTNFVSGAAVRWNGADRVTTFVSATQLTAAIPATDIVNIGTAQITVFNPANVSGGGGVSNALTLTINPPPNPVPTLTQLQPNQIGVGAPAFTLTVSGSNFVSGAVVRWNGAERATTFVSATQLTAAIPASDAATGGTANVTVFNPANVSGGGGSSNALSFTINNPIPALATIAPTTALAGSAALTLIVNGTNFVNGSAVRWNGENRATAFVSSTQLTAQITAADLASPSVIRVTVFNPAPGGGSSGGANFVVNAPNPVPTLTSLNPANANAGGAAFALTVNGANFVSNSAVRWNGADRVTAFISATQLTAQIAAADIASPGTATVTVFTPAPGGGTSNALSFTINQLPNPVPTLTSLNPNTLNAGGPGVTLAVNGTSFVSGASVRWNGANRPTLFISATQLSAQIPASDVASVGTAQITVFNPASANGGGGTSNALTFTITPAPNPVPALVSLNPNQATAGGAAFTLTVNGNSFLSNSVVRWNGAERATTFVSQTQLSAQIPASEIASAGTATVTVFNPASAGGGGGTSNALTFTVTQAPNPAPTLTALNPAFALAGSAAFDLTVNGSNFISASTVRWNGAERATTFVSATQLRAAIPAADLVNAGAVPITVFNPAPGGGTSAALNFAVALPLANVSAASFSGTEFAAEMVVSAFGSNLATGNASAATQPLPTTLRDTTVRVRDSAGVERLAPLFFVGPSQVNYLVPTGTANGPATVIISGADNRLSATNIIITTVAPGLFTANANGQGVPAGYLVRVRGDGSQSFEAIASTGPTGQQVPLALDLGPETEQVFLVLFGTGFRKRSALSAVTATIGGANAEVGFAGAQGDLAGLDQTNLRLPRALVGRGEVEVLLRVDGKAANAVRIAIK
ncbi:MAG: hypothetical protein HYR56_01470 [Acidobacteria bacterium]|nr:hypothetical protein [Acidobacteriota bacterium]MBI3427101.1 hypothetical protein [Acidobacteriota bacterium]